MVILIGLKILYSFLYRKYINQFHLLYFLLLPSLSLLLVLSSYDFKGSKDLLNWTKELNQRKRLTKCGYIEIRNFFHWKTLLKTSKKWRIRINSLGTNMWAFVGHSRPQL
jgi:hypothetical protein